MQTKSNPHKIQIRADFADFFGEQDPFEKILNIQGEVFREHKNRKTMRISKGGKGYFIKIHRRAGWAEILKNLLNLNLPVLSAEEELNAIKKLEELGIETARVVGFGIRGTAPAWLESFIITEELENTISLENLSRDWDASPPAFLLKLAVIKKIADIARRLHQNGVNHRDFYICHFLIDLKSLETISDAEPRIYLIDLHRVQLRKRVPERWIIKDLAGLYFSSLDIGLSKKDVLRFMKFYSGKSLRNIVSEDSCFWELVQRRAARLYERVFKRLPGFQI